MIFLERSLSIDSVMATGIDIYSINARFFKESKFFKVYLVAKPHFTKKF